MFYVNDSIKTVGEALPFSGSVLDAIVGYLRMYPDVTSICVFRDCGRLGSRSDFQFICSLDQKQLNRIRSRFNERLSHGCNCKQAVPQDC